MHTYKLLFYDFNGIIYLHKIFFKKLLSYYFIDLCQILNRLKLRP